MGIFERAGATEPIEMELYRKAQAEHPEVFTLLNTQLAAADKGVEGPEACRKPGNCKTLLLTDGSGRCLDVDGDLVMPKDGCAPLLLVGNAVQQAQGKSQCLDTWSDQDPLTWGFYGCHGGANQRFSQQGAQGRLCSEQA